MGMFDTLHTDDRCVQVKCFYKTLSSIWPGDLVALRRPPTEQELAAAAADGGDTAVEDLIWKRVARTETSWQIRCEGDVYAVFVDNTFAGFEPAPRDGLIVVTSHGNDAGDDSYVPAVTSPDECSYHD